MSHITEGMKWLKYKRIADIPEPTCPETKECDHVWAMNGWGTCLLCGGWKPKPIRPEKVVEKHCTMWVDPEKDCPNLQCCDFACDGCESWQTVEPAEKRYIVSATSDIFTDYNKAQLKAMEWANEHRHSYYVAKVIGEAKVLNLKPTTVWHEEQ